MFDDTPPQAPEQPTTGPMPGQPIRPFGSPAYGAQPSPMSVSPESIRTIPPPPGPPMFPPKRPVKSGGGGKRLLLILILVLVLLGGGVAVAALVFPKITGTNNANTNTVANANTNKTNLNRTNTNRSNTNLTNSTANVNVANSNLPSNLNGTANTNAANLNASNTNTTNTNVNASNLNTNTTNTNAVVNTNTPPASYSLDTDGDKLNDYLEGWVGTSKTNADSDGDGFPDGNEVINQYSPLGGGTMTAAGYQSFCAKSTIVTQYGLPSTDVTTLCGIGSDMISNIQVMATNAQFYDDLQTELTNSCTSFGKIDKTVCAGLTSFLIVNYLVSG